MVLIVISSDEIKKKLLGYDPRKAEVFHVMSSKIADREFSLALKKNSGKKVILMSGGAASGKTEFISSHLNNFHGIVFDTTLPTFLGAKIKIEKILKAQKVPCIYGIFPKSFLDAFAAFLNRDRKFSDEHFFRTHEGSRKTLLMIAENYPNVSIRVFKSEYLKSKSMIFEEYIFTDRAQIIEFLKKSQYTQDLIKKAV